VKDTAEVKRLHVDSLASFLLAYSVAPLNLVKQPDIFPNCFFYANTFGIIHSQQSETMMVLNSE